MALFPIGIGTPRHHNDGGIAHIKNTNLLQYKSGECILKHPFVYGIIFLTPVEKVRHCRSPFWFILIIVKYETIPISNPFLFDYSGT